MGNKSNITFESSPSYGYNLSRTSYDVHQEINAKVIGVLKYNNEIRKKLLSRNIGQYKLIPKEEGIGYISNIYSNNSHKPFPLGEDGLLGYTHLDNTPLKKEIQNKYDMGDILNYYRMNPNINERNFRWNGHFYDYISYINDTLGFPITIFDIASNINNENKTGIVSSLVNHTNLPDTPCALDALNFLATHVTLNEYGRSDFRQYMDNTRIGVVKPQPMEVLVNNAVTTNVNNFSGIDTRLGLISNEMYANVLYNSAQFNSARNTKYITPDVYENIGNKLNTISILSSDYRINPDTGRLAYDLSGVYHDMKTYQDAIFKNYVYDNHYDNGKDKFTGKLGLGKEIWSTKLTENGIKKDKLESVIFDNVNTIDDIRDNNLARLKNLQRNRLHFKNNYETYFYNDSENKSFHETFEYNLREHIDTGVFHETTIETYKKRKSSPIGEVTIGIFGLDKNDKGDIKPTSTIISKFYTEGRKRNDNSERSFLQSAVTNKFGLSHGRNLLTKNTLNGGEPKKIAYKNSYNVHLNPYCRVWTWGHKYDTINKLIRPFSGEDKIIGVDELQKDWYKYGRRKGSAERLKDNSVLNRNGFVNITPVQEKENFINETKKCMFSIENLAWKDITKVEGTTDISKEQIGPNGGRIMWFPPYDIKFNEAVNVNWQSNDFIGRGEKVYTYSNTERSGTLSFTLLVDYPSVIDMWRKHNSVPEHIHLDGDDFNGKEQALLRFFAGCDTLEFDNKPIQKNEEEDKKIIPESEPDPELDEQPGDIIFYIFFPNDFSGCKSDNTVDTENFIDNCDYLTNIYEVEDGEQDLTSYQGYEWRYRVDNDMITHKLKYPNNYKNNTNFELNLTRDKILESFSDATDSFNDIFSNNNGSGIIEKVKIKAYASSHGNNTSSDVNENRNDKLSKRRANFAKYYVKSHWNIPDDSIITIEDVAIHEVEEQDKNNVSGRSAKLARSARVEVIFKKGKSIDNPNVEEGVTNENYISTNAELSNAKIATATKTIEKSEENTDNEQRWENEGVYFEHLKDNDEFHYNEIIKKIQYFNPAYHSITPEGFNARLGFLHQCTRQGPTLGSSETESNSAGNLAFGRPPICILRLGDFYNTRILITSLTIGFDETPWDLNTEGIGVQPMFARVSLNIVFLGGSDLTAPISRLQNAVSFNYYANQSIYDNRADIGTYENGKAKIKGTPWRPNMDLSSLKPKIQTNNNDNTDNK